MLLRLVEPRVAQVRAMVAKDMVCFWFVVADSDRDGELRGWLLALLR